MDARQLIGVPPGPNHYDLELQKLTHTYSDALAIDVSGLKQAIAGASESSLIGVGSGGSFTVASLLCNLHEAYTGRVSRPSTPLEIICNPTLASASPVFLISAEGKNPDIIEALLRARRQSARAVHVITNRKDSPLMHQMAQLSDISSHVFELSDKDGYLATNSLLLNAVVIARAYGELDQATETLPATIDDFRIDGGTVEQWIQEADGFIEEAVSRRGLIVTYSPLLRPIATDLESKLSEAALLYCQLADLRSFAHGRHLWLADRPGDCAILALVDPSLHGLWSHMRLLMPSEIPTLPMPLDGAWAKDLIAGLVAQMHLVGRIAKHTKKDPGRPQVPQFGRDLFDVDLPTLVPRPRGSTDRDERAKYEVLGARWPTLLRHGAMQRALETYKTALEQQVFRAIVFDYDGTLCTSQRKDAPPPEPILRGLGRLAEGSVIVGIASGRGGSIQEKLRDSLPEAIWSKLQLGLYNGGWITEIEAQQQENPATSEFLSHVARIVGRLKMLGVPIETVRTTHPYQVSVRFREGIATENMWFVIADAMRQAGLDFSRMVRSKHSVNILAAGINKSRLIAHIIQIFKVEPYQVLTMGDEGAWPGNDSELLEHRFSLSVDLPSRRLDRGWKLAPPHKRGVNATLWYLERIALLGEGSFRVTFGQTAIETNSGSE